MKMAEAFVSLYAFIQNNVRLRRTSLDAEERNMRCFSGKEQRWPKSSSTRIDPLNNLFSSLLDIWEARLSRPIMGGNGWFDVASGRGLGSFPTLCQKGHTRRKSQGNGCKAPIQMRHPISSFHAVYGSTLGSLDTNRRKRHPFRSLQMRSELRNSMIKKSKGMRWIWCQGVSWHMMMQSCDSTRSCCESARMAFTGLWEGHFPLVSVPVGLTVGFQAAGKHILLHSHSGRGIVIFLFFSRVPADAVVWWRFVSRVTIPA